MKLDARGSDMVQSKCADDKEISGIIIIDKPQGMTSHDIVDFMRKRFSIKKAGHAGTLDPMATGVLVILLGKTTKKSGELINDDKEYEGILTLGVKTDTGDKCGKVICEKTVSPLEKNLIEKVFNEFQGQMKQVPPAFCALKHKGRPLYKFAREGIEVKKEPRDIVVKELVILKYDFPDVHFRVWCSKGTYVRKLCQDIGDRLECGAHLSGLRRMRSGVFSIEKALPLNFFKNIKKEELSLHLYEQKF